MRVLLAGKHELAAAVLEALGGCGLQLAVAPAQSENPNRYSGRSLRELAHECGAQILSAAGRPALGEAIASFKPDVLLSLGYDRILRPEVLGAVPYRANVHFGALPKYRGSWSIPWAIMNEEPDIGVTLHEIADGIDDGPIIFSGRIANDAAWSCRRFYDAAVDLGAALAVGWLMQLRCGRPPTTKPQDEALASYYGPGYPNAFQINWAQSSRQISNYIRAAYFPPMKSAYSRIGQSTVEFHWPIQIRASAENAPPGTIVMTAEGLGVCSGDSAIAPIEVSVDGERTTFPAFVEKGGLMGRHLE